MTIVLCGSGSGGHITPLIAVAKELRKTSPTVKIVYLGERGGKFANMLDEVDLFDCKYFIYSGKFRRYHTQSVLSRFLDIKTIFLNIKDFVKITVGILQGVILFKKLKADKVLLKGGSVCIPAGFGARFAKVTTYTHDSDALPGLSNRIGGKHAKYHFTAMPAKYYRYPEGKILHVGIPINEDFGNFSSVRLKDLKQSYGIPQNSLVLLVTGGSNGARRMNGWVSEVLPNILHNFEDLYVLFLTGKGNVVQTKQLPEKRVKIIEFTTKMEELSLISDLIITRAGATTINEFALGKKALILIPNPDLTGGHQLKNAQVYQEANAAEVIEEIRLKQDVKILEAKITELLRNTNKRKELGENLNKTLPKVPASVAIARVLLEK